jgi:hypothetical protein
MPRRPRSWRGRKRRSRIEAVRSGILCGSLRYEDPVTTSSVASSSTSAKPAPREPPAPDATSLERPPLTTTPPVCLRRRRPSIRPRFRPHTSFDFRGSRRTRSSDCHLSRNLMLRVANGTDRTVNQFLSDWSLSKVGGSAVRKVLKNVGLVPYTMIHYDR